MEWRRIFLSTFPFTRPSHLWATDPILDHHTWPQRAGEALAQDAIESLSPEQQGFAKAFRAMQLESTLFGIVAPRSAGARRRAAAELTEVLDTRTT